MSSIGKLNEFDVKSGNWALYIDRMKMFFVVNKITVDFQLPSLIATIGDEAYELLVNLASPKKPADMSFEEVDSLMRQHLQPTPSVLAERYKFRQRRQEAGESVADFVAVLKRLARYCKFTVNLDESLRDQFVCGLRSDVIRQRLFAEDDSVSFSQAVRLASSLESAERDAAMVEAVPNSGVPSSSTSAVNALGSSAGYGKNRGHSHRQAGARQIGAPIRGGKVTGNCAACGATNHNFETCRFKGFICSKCTRSGHLRRVCPENKKQQTGATYKRGERGDYVHHGVAGDESIRGAVEDLEEDINLMGLNNYKAVSLAISIDGKVVNMEIDTGTAISCISEGRYRRDFSHLCLQKDDTVLRFYDGSRVNPLGIIWPRVRYLGNEKVLALFVIRNGTTSLIGRQWLAELQIEIPMLVNDRNTVGAINSLQTCDVIEKLIDRFKELFSGGLGRYKGGKATLRVRDGAMPVFHRARPVPYALRERIDVELDGMLRDGVIEPVDCSDWASPLVPVSKADGTLRICADYKATLNPVLLVDRYPLPRVEDVLVGLNGAQFFSKLDLSQAYNQIELDETKKYTVVSTHRGLFRYNRLVFGLSSSVGIFQRIMTGLLGNIPNVQVFLDDVIIGGRTKEEHLKALESVFQRLCDNGLKLKKQKCVFLVDKVTYLGYVVSKHGVEADKSKIEAIIKLRAPENVSELRSFIGMVNFFSKFIKNFSSFLVPLNNLLRKGVVWKWDKECESAFMEVKQALIGTDVLAHYDPKKPLIVTCDASGRGIGGVLAQTWPAGERPVAYASRSLTTAEKNYSQIHREALAIVFCMKKFHQYIFGRKFILRTDHKPLVSILGPQMGIPTMTASRMQRWAVILSAYNYDIEYIRTSDNCADGLSRLPKNIFVQDKEEGSIPEQTYLHFAQDGLLLEYSEIKNNTERDAMLCRVLNYVRNGWPEKCELINLQPYFNRKRELYEELGCVMWGHRLVIPENCRAKVLKIVHEPHMGIVKSKALARSYVWWPGIDEEVERECRACSVCAAQADSPPGAPPKPWPWPLRPWSRLHLDFMGPIGGKMYLVVVDAHSKWIEVFQVPSTAANHTISKLGELWSRWGLPLQIVSDNGPPFMSSEFSEFLKGVGVQHILTAPYHPASNGAAENAVKTLKAVIKKALLEKKDVEKALHTFLLYYRNIEHCTTGVSPATLLLGRRLRTRLDVLRPEQMIKVQRAQQRQVENAGGVNRSMDVGDEVWFRQYLKGEKWVPGTVVNTTGPRDFSVLDADGKQVHRHIDQLRRRTRSSLVIPTGSTQPQDTRPSFASSSGERSECSQDSVPPAYFPTEQCPVSPMRSGIGVPASQSPTSGGQCSGTESFSTPPSNPEPPQRRPIRQCRLHDKTKCKFCLIVED